MKLVKNTKTVKLPRHTSSVAATFRRALDKAQKHGAKDVIIITRDDGGCDISCSRMSVYTAIGIMKRGELLITEEI